ncbi:tRNA pseudouridine synthase 1 [Ceratocystis pirilliformis]|uniref:tRNA pseudouridine synthase 1 n=1 Tax=Ceratocystis pirilliformis TaxID=259994 RepID=A0ABR3ZK89_9PEZI
MAPENTPSQSIATAVPAPAPAPASSTNATNGIEQKPGASESRDADKPKSNGGGRDRDGGDRGKRQGRHKKRKADYEWKNTNKRSRNHEPEGGWPQRKPRENPFTAEEIAGEERKPKKKVAVLIGYSGTGYKGMQINDQEKTIEGDLFAAFVAAGTIAKANADDHKKSSLMRCARTDKGVHAAGNVISLKLILEEDTVEKVNSHLPDQIRVWGIQRTNNQFNCYKSCDSRWYEYLLPTYCLLPPHPKTFLGKNVWEQATAKGTLDELNERYADVKGFWDEVDEKEIKPILESLDSETRTAVLERMHALDILAGGLVDGAVANKPAERKQKAETKPVSREATAEPEAKAAAAPAVTNAPINGQTETTSEAKPLKAETDTEEPIATTAAAAEEPTGSHEPTPVDFALRDIKYAYINAKRRYRVTPERLAQLQSALDKYVGTHNFYNYTVRTEFKDAAAKRHIKSFVANTTPIVIGKTEWISLKVHGQSFMMHQIRKMVGLACLVTRCGSPLSIIDTTYEGEKMAIPKAPSLGLLLERPVFESYNNKATTQLGRDSLDFSKHEDRMLPFKHEYIYNRIYEVEEKDNSFHEFFQQVDNFKSSYFLWLTAGGLEAARAGAGKVTDATNKAVAKQLEGDDDEEDVECGDG